MSVGGQLPCPAAAIYEKYRVDKIFLLGTTHSMWGEVYYYFGKQNNEFDEDIWAEITDHCEKANHESELVFCFHLVGRLLQAGYTVVASTSTRNAVCNADGMKISQFEFVNFREY